jgi:hypothetical protein
MNEDKMKRLDCSGSSKADGPDFGFATRLTGPDILFPLVSRTSKKAAIFCLSKSALTAKWACVGGLSTQFCLKLSNAFFQGGDTFRQLKDIASAVLYPIKRLFAHPNFNGCCHG